MNNVFVKRIVQFPIIHLLILNSLAVPFLFFILVPNIYESGRGLLFSFDLLLNNLKLYVRLNPWSSSCMMLFVGTNTLSTEVPAPLAEAPIQLSFSQGPRAESLAPTARDRGFLHCKVSTICLCLHPKFRTLCHYTVGLIANLSITGNLRNSGQVINMRGHFSVPGY